jgi:hypothetical protein
MNLSHFIRDKILVALADNCLVAKPTDKELKNEKSCVYFNVRAIGFVLYFSPHY